MFASMLTFNPRSKATNIGYLLSGGAVSWLMEASGFDFLFDYFGFLGEEGERSWRYWQCKKGLKPSTSFLSPSALFYVQKPFKARTPKDTYSLFAPWKLRVCNKLLEKPGSKVLILTPLCFVQLSQNQYFTTGLFPEVYISQQQKSQKKSRYLSGFVPLNSIKKRAGR